MFAKKDKLLLFDLHKLETLAQTNDTKFVWLLEKWYKTRDTIPRIGDKYKLLEPIHGSSFLINPDNLFKSNVDIIYKAQAIKLAARRDIVLYRLYNSTSILKSYYADLNISMLQSNPLLTITETEIIINTEKQNYGN